MSDYAELVGRHTSTSTAIDADKATTADLIAWLQDSPFPHDHKAADAIKALVQERDEARTLAIRRGEIQVRLQDEVRTERDRAEKAEAALAECMAHAGAMASDLDAVCRGTVTVAEFRAWRAKHGK